MNNNGVCTLVAKGADPANECMNGVCNGSSECEYENGHACGVAENCISTFCVVGLCCPTACAQGASCETGACKCPGTNPLECGDICKDGATDNNHCGACDTTCDITNNVGCVNSKCEDLTWAQWPVAEQPAYVVDEVNGTVVDPVTKLMWQREVDGSTYDWQGAKDHCAGLTHAGYDDWRLPTRIELVSIVDYTKTNPAIDTVAFGANASSGVFWTSSPWAGAGSAAWFVLFDNGFTGSVVVSDTSRVRCVR